MLYYIKILNIIDQNRSFVPRILLNSSSAAACCSLWNKMTPGIMKLSADTPFNINQSSLRVISDPTHTLDTERE